MVIAAYSTDLTDMDLAASATGWAEATASGWTSVFAITGGDTDDYIQDTTCNSTTVKTGVGALLYNNGAGITLSQDDAVLVWSKWDVSPSLDTEANGGIRTVMGNALNAFYGFKHLGSDSYIYDGWINLATGDPADADITPDYTVGTPTTVKQYHGWAFNALSVPSKGNPYKVDAIRYGRCEIICINGDVTAYGTFADMALENDYNDATNGFNRWGLFRKVTADNYLWKGLMSLGNATVVDFRDSNATILIDNTKHVTPAFNAIEINNASSRVDWDGVTISALGTVSVGSLTVVDNADVNFNGCLFVAMGVFTFLANSDILDTQFIRCDQIIHGGGIMNGSSVLTSIVVADTGALYYNVAADPDGVMDNMTISSGATAHHAIDFGTAVDSTLTSITLRGIDFSGFGSVDDANDATVRFLATTGSLTLNLIDCTVDGVSPVATGGGKNFSVDDAAGMTVTVVVAPVTLEITVTDRADDLPIQNVQTSIHLADSPYTELMNEDTTAAGVASESYAGSTPVDIVWKTRKSDDLDTPRYKAKSGKGQITTAGFTQAVLLEENTILS